MKKLIYLSIAMMFLLVACDPMEDIHEEIDALDNPVVGEDEYTLTSDDYETLELDYESFNTEDEAKESIPGLLSDMYPYWGKGSSVLVNYNLYVGNAEGVDELTDASVYDLTTADYLNSGSDAPGFYPEVDANEEIVDVLAGGVADAVEGDIILATYNHYTEVPTIGLAIVEEYDFTAGFLTNFTSENITGAQVWEEGSYGGAEYASMSGYDSSTSSSVANDDWLISPEIDLTNSTNAAVQINQAINYADDVSLLEVYVTKDFDGTVAGSTWEKIDFQTIPTGSDWNVVLSEDYDISSYDGETINIAFRYQSTVTDASSWQVNNFYVKEIGIAGDYDSKGAYFAYDGSAWEQIEDAYYLSSADYDAMGAPGQYDNFSSSDPADSYVPAFLALNYPYAQEEDQMIVVYKYYSSSAGETQTRGNLYTYMSGSWMPYESTQEISLQFGFDGDNWVPDNTITYMLTSTDYDYVGAEFANYVDEATGEDYSSAAGNLSDYGNFNRSGGPTSWSDTMMVTVLSDLLANVIAPNAEDEQKYLINADTYNGGNVVESFSFIKKSGSWVLNEE